MITGIKSERKRRKVRVRMKCDDKSKVREICKRSLDQPLLALTMEGSYRPSGKLLETEKSKKMDSPLKSPERNAALLTP